MAISPSETNYSSSALTGMGTSVTRFVDDSSLAEITSLPSSLSTKARDDIQYYVERSLENPGYTINYGTHEGTYKILNGKVYKSNQNIFDNISKSGQSTSSSASSSRGIGTAASEDGKSSTATTRTSSTATTRTSSTATTGTSSTTDSSTQSSSTLLKSSSTTGATDVKGLNAAGITAIKNAISQFAKGYSSKVANLGTTTATIQNAVKGTASEKAISNLSAAINSSVTQSLNKLNTFANQLDTVKSAYSKADSSNTSVTTYTTNLGKK